ncbi:hypothetical protein [Streptomyces sp. NPDC057910]|uniref:hypothetical protein n=1 Tax=Streptomyces sp. NPDC057910 TaxID=3346278 RepID=UPI0036E3A98D
MLIGAALRERAHAALACCADHCPLPGPAARPVVMMLTLRIAHTGTGNLVGEDLIGLDLRAQRRGGATSRLRLAVASMQRREPSQVPPGSLPENPTPVAIPSLSPDGEGPGPFLFGRTTRSKLSGWAQKAVADKNLRKTKSTAATRMLPLVLAAPPSLVRPLGPSGEDLAPEAGMPHLRSR